jgi:hypothetical protein
MSSSQHSVESAIQDRVRASDRPPLKWSDLRYVFGILGILVSDALDQPGKYLPIGWFRLRLHDVRRAAEVSRHQDLYASQILLILRT